MRPLSRSLTFWSGILVMAFIVWAWRDSFQRFAEWDDASVQITSCNGGLMAGRFPGIERAPEGFSWGASPSLRPDWNAFQAALFQRGTHDGSREIYQGDLDAARDAREYYQISMYFQGEDSWMLFVPYWLALLVIAMPWIALLLWRARRGKPRTIVEPNR